MRVPAVRKPSSACRWCKRSAAEAYVVLMDGACWDCVAGIAVSNFPGDYIAGTDSNDYTEDLERRMEIHRCLLYSLP